MGFMASAVLAAGAGAGRGGAGDLRLEGVEIHEARRRSWAPKLRPCADEDIIVDQKSHVYTTPGFPAGGGPRLAGVARAWRKGWCGGWWRAGGAACGAPRRDHWSLLTDYWSGLLVEAVVPLDLIEGLAVLELPGEVPSSRFLIRWRTS